MDTDRLIHTLAADNDHRERTVGFMLAAALALAVPVSAVLFMMELGPRQDFMAATRNPFFGLKFVVTLGLALAATGLCLQLARPGASIKRWRWLLAIPAGLLGIGIVGDLMVSQQVPWTRRMMGTNSLVCLTAIPLLSLPLLVAAFAALRHGAPTRPALAGAFAGLLSAGVAATLYAAHCFDDSPLFVAIWYSTAIALVTAIGALLGPRLLRF